MGGATGFFIYGTSFNTTNGAVDVEAPWRVQMSQSIKVMVFGFACRCST